MGEILLNRIIAKKLLAFFAVFASLNILFLFLTGSIGLNFVSQINLQLFSVFLSLLISFFVAFKLFGPQIVLKFDINSTLKAKYALILSVAAFVILIVFIRFDIYQNYGMLAFQPWVNIPFDIVSGVLIYVFVLFVPTYLLHSFLLSEHQLSLLEKLLFYPVISLFFFGCLNFALPLNGIAINLKFMVLPLLAVLLSLFSVYHIKRRKFLNSVCSTNSTNLVTAISLFLVILFAFFTLFSTIGGINGFLRGDATGGAQGVGYINKYGLTGYLNAPLTERYPIFYYSSWSAISKLLPLPYINTVILVEFFNLAFLVLSFYWFTTLIFKNPRERLFSTIVFVVVSGFSWFYLIAYPPQQLLSRNDFLSYIWQIINKFGTESGGKYSFINADDHSLARLWSLGLTLVSAASLGKYLSNKQKGYLLIFLIGFIQIALGHSAELILLSFLSFALFYLNSKNLTKVLLFSLGLSTVLAAIIAWELGYLSALYMVIFFPLLAFVFAKILKSTFAVKRTRLHFVSSHKRRILSVLAIAFLFYYGLSWIAFLSMPQLAIATPIFSLWFSLPVQFGFPGLLFTLVLVSQSLLNWKSLDFGLKFVLIVFILLLGSVFLINYANLSLFYIYVPAYIVPYYFIPVFALASAYSITGLNFSVKRLRINPIVFTTILAALLLVSSFSVVLSSSYWSVSGWNSESSPTNSLTTDDIQFVNFMYSLPAKRSYAVVGFLPSGQPIPSLVASDYQTLVRYKVPYVYNLISLSGMRTPQKLAESVLYDAQNLDELEFLKRIYPIDYLVVDKNSTSFLANLLKDKMQPLFDGEYFVYDISNLGTPNITRAFEKVILIDKVNFAGNLSIKDSGSQDQQINGVVGSITPLGNGHVLVQTNYYDKDPEKSENFVFLWSVDSSYWKPYAFGSGAVGSPTLTENDSTADGGSGSLRIDVTPENNVTFWSVQHDYSPSRDWSNYDSLVLWWYGLNTGSVVNIDLVTNSWDNYFRYSFADDFTQWHQVILHLDEPTASHGTPLLSNITAISLGRSSTLRTGTYYLGFGGLFTQYSLDFSTPELTISGNSTMVNMRSTSDYFPESMNVAQKIVFNGTIAFDVLNTFDQKRLYLSSFVNNASYQISPQPWQVTAETARLYIQQYVNETDIPFFGVLGTPIGLTWAMICIVLFLTPFPWRKIIASLRNKQNLPVASHLSQFSNKFSEDVSQVEKSSSD